MLHLITAEGLKPTNTTTVVHQWGSILGHCCHVGIPGPLLFLADIMVNVEMPIWLGQWGVTFHDTRGI